MGLGTEKAEMYTAINSLLYEMLMVSEVVLLTMFEDKQSVGGKYPFCEYEVGQFAQSIQGIGRICKDEVECFVAFFDIAEYIGT